MSASPDTLIDQQATKALEKLFSRVRSLEANDYYRPRSVTGVTSNPPTDAELDSLLGTPPSYNGDTVALVRDTTNGRYWLVYGDNVSWYVISMWLADSTITGVRRTRNTNQSISSGGGTTAISWSGTDYNIGGFTFPVATRIVVPIAGIYSIKASVRWASSSAGVRYLQINTSAGGPEGSVITNAVSTTVTDQQVMLEKQMVANDYVEVHVFQNSGGPLDITSTTFLPWVAVNLITA